MAFPENHCRFFLWIILVFFFLDGKIVVGLWSVVIFHGVCYILKFRYANWWLHTQRAPGPLICYQVIRIKYRFTTCLRVMTWFIIHSTVATIKFAPPKKKHDSWQNRLVILPMIFIWSFDDHSIVEWLLRLLHYCSE